MPEGPEISLYKDFIKKTILGKNINNIEILKGRYVTHGPFDGYQALKDALPLKVIEVDKKGKLIWIKFENNFVIVDTCGMSGNFISCDVDDNYILPGNTKLDLTLDYHNKLNKHRNFKYILDDITLYKSDQRNFGTMTVLYDNPIEKLHNKLSMIGPDLLNISFTFPEFILIMRKKSLSQKQVGNVLIDQKVISSIGNYARAEILYIAKISPHRIIESLTEDELYTLFNASRILLWSFYDIEKGREYGIINDDSIYPAKFNRSFLVYNQKKDLLGNDIKYEKLYVGSQVRYIYWVVDVQK